MYPLLIRVSMSIVFGAGILIGGLLVLHSPYATTVAEIVQWAVFGAAIRFAISLLVRE